MRRTLPFVLALAACGGPAAPSPGCGALGCQVTIDRFVQAAPTAVDLLVVVGTASTTSAARAALVAGLDELTAPLVAGHADLHVGIITSDLGAGTFTPPSCPTPGGDGGRLQNLPRGATCAAAHLVDAADHFLAAAPGPADAPLATNFTGTLADAVACYAELPTGGCAYEHHLAAVGDALDGCLAAGGCSVTENEGFLRPGASLALLVVALGDDCSARPDATLFDPSPAAAGAFGPLGTYRCFEFGVLCGGADPGRQAGVRAACAPGDADPDPRHELIPVELYAAFLQSLKADPRAVDVTVLAGPPVPVSVLVDASGAPELAPSCVGPIGAATPAVRLGAFADLFDADRGRLVTACHTDLPGALTTVGAGLAAPTAVASVCLSEPLEDGAPGAPGLQPQCAVSERPAGTTATPTPVPPCDPVLCDPAAGVDCACAAHALPAGAPGCWYLVPDAACGPAGGRFRSDLRVRIDRGSYAACDPVLPSAATETTIECATCAGDGAAGTSDCTSGCAWNWPAACAGSGDDGGGP